jgi:hypothetical protein
VTTPSHLLSSQGGHLTPPHLFLSSTSAAPLHFPSNRHVSPHALDGEKPNRTTARAVAAKLSCTFPADGNRSGLCLLIPEQDLKIRRIFENRLICRIIRREITKNRDKVSDSVGADFFRIGILEHQQKGTRCPGGGRLHERRAFCQFQGLLAAVWLQISLHYSGTSCSGEFSAVQYMGRAATVWRMGICRSLCFSTFTRSRSSQALPSYSIRGYTAQTILLLYSWSRCSY